MLSTEERLFIYRHAYLPEHLPDYVEAISGARAHLRGNYVCFVRKNHLIFNGYPLNDNAADVAQAYKAACDLFKPATVAILAPQLWLSEESLEQQDSDHFYQLALPLTAIDSQVAYMVRRAERELSLRLGVFGRDHKRLIKDFIKIHDLKEAQIHIYKHIQHYLKRSTSARVLEARKDERLVAFTILDLGSANYAFYLFNFRSRKINVPGASDLLFKEMVELAHAEGKKAINLGLGIHPGIRRFKEKWGGVPFLPYIAAMVHRKPMDLGKLADKL